jgi:hypothetical protein
LICLNACDVADFFNRGDLSVRQIEQGARQMKMTSIVILVSTMASIGTATAQTGPVATQCKEDIAKYCASETHDGGIRSCLQNHYDKVTAACQQALDTTGGGQGKGMGKGKSK